MDTIKMNALKEGKTSYRVKDALQRNHIAANNMKTSVKSTTTSLNKKEMDSLKYKQAFYQQRKKQLEATNPQTQRQEAGTKTSLNRSPVSSLESQRGASNQASFQSITELNSRPRSMSTLSSSPSIEISDFDSKTQNSAQNKLPSLSSTGNSHLTAERPLRGRAKSASDIFKDVAVFLDNTTPDSRRLSSGGDLTIDEYLAKRRRSSVSSYLLASPIDASLSRSAPTSPVRVRKSLANAPGGQNSRSVGRKGNPRRKRASNEDVHAQADSLADSLNKIKFCRYLRDADGEEMLNNEEKLPDQLKPKEIVLGHTKVVF